MKTRVVAFALALAALALLACSEGSGTANLSGTPFVFNFSTSATPTPVIEGELTLEAEAVLAVVEEPAGAAKRWDRAQWWGAGEQELWFNTGSGGGWVLHWTPIDRGCEQPGTLDVYLGEATANAVMVSDPAVLATFRCGGEGWSATMGTQVLEPNHRYVVKVQASGRWLIDVQPPLGVASGRMGVRLYNGALVDGRDNRF